MPRDNNFVEIEDFFDNMPERNIEPATPKSKRVAELVAAVVAFLVITVVVPVSLALPVAIAVDAASDQAELTWDHIPYEIPEVPTLPGYTHVYDSKGNQIAQFFSENRQPVVLDNVSPHLVDAIISVEDRKFWEHQGVDGAGVVRAGRENFEAGRTVQGASTITQQLIKNMRLMNASSDAERAAVTEQTLARKIIEAKSALAVEEEMSKEEILEMYMNIAYFGAGSYGVGAAADRFFGVDVSELTIAQAALIAGMVREPSGLDPFENPERALNRRNTVLVSMYENETITKAEYNEAIATPVDVSEGRRPPNGCDRSPYPFYCAVVRQQLLSDPRLGRTQGERDALFYRGNLEVHTALDPEVMENIEVAIGEALDNDNRVATSVVVVQPGTGLVLGFGQNREWGAGGDSRTEIPYVTSQFQPGSSFKPVVLAAALDQGWDVNRTMTTASGYRPPGMDYPNDGFRNYAGANYGSVNAYNATRLSSNVWYTKLIADAGVAESVEMAKKMGVNESLEGLTISNRSAAFALGSWEVTPLEMANVYATMAAAGSSCDPVFITDIFDSETEKSIYSTRSSCDAAYSHSASEDIMDVMQWPFREGGTASRFPLSGREAIGKTGTTNNHAAAWFVGATPQYATAVWIGDPRGGQRYPLYDVRAYGTTYAQVFGADISGPLWNDVMTRIHNGEPSIDFSEVSQAPVAPQALSDLAAPPRVKGMAVLSAVALLESLGFTVSIENGTSPEASPNIVASSAYDFGHVTITAGNGTDSVLLGSVLTVRDGVLIVEGGR